MRIATKQSTAGGNITFQKTVNGAFSLEANTAGNEVFNGRVGNTTALTSLITDASNVGSANKAAQAKT